MSELQYTLAASWTAPTSCFATTNYYYVLLGSGYFSNMYGTPTPVLTGNTPTGSCFPPSFTIDQPYTTTGGCPSGYTLACASAMTESNGQTASQVTCCPSITSDVFSFMCKNNQYGCHATATAGVVWTGVETNIGIATPTEQPITRTPSTAEGIEAWGIKFISVSPSTTTSTSTPSQTTATASPSPTIVIQTTNALNATSTATSSPSPQSGSLQTGPIVGITIGCVAAVALTFVGAYLYRRRRRRGSQAQTTTTYMPYPVPKEEYKRDPQAEPYQLDAQEPPLAELPS